MRFRQHCRHQEGGYQIAAAPAAEDYQEYAGRKINITNSTNVITKHDELNNGIRVGVAREGIPIIAVIFISLLFLRLLELIYA